MNKEIELFLSLISFWDEREVSKNVNQKNVQFWAKHKRDTENKFFWTEQFKASKENAKKLAIALDNIPLPGAFQSAALVLRSLIREKRKAKSCFQVELSVLYWLAAIKSLCVPYSEVLQEPGFNVFSSIPGKVIRGIVINYNDIGYEKLDLLTKTDVNLLIECFGESTNHTTLNIIYSSMWRKYELELKTEKDNDLKDFFANLGE